MDFLSSLSDDQKALLGCVVALTCTSLLLMVSNLIGKSRSSNNNSASTIAIQSARKEKKSDKKAA